MCIFRFIFLWKYKKRKINKIKTNGKTNVKSKCRNKNRVRNANRYHWAWVNVLSSAHSTVVDTTSFHIKMKCEKISKEDWECKKKKLTCSPPQILSCHTSHKQIARNKTNSGWSLAMVSVEMQKVNLHTILWAGGNMSTCKNEIHRRRGQDRERMRLLYVWVWSECNSSKRNFML